MMTDDGKQWRVLLSLDGNGLSPLRKVYGELVEILRSGEPLMPELRDALANALERGQIGGPGVRLKIEAEAGFFRAIGTIESDKRLLDWGRHIAIERASGRSFEGIYRDLGKPEFREEFAVSVDDVRDYGLRARSLFSEFEAFSEARRRELEALLGATDGDLLSDDDFYYPARALFTEAKVGLHEQWPGAE